VNKLPTGIVHRASGRYWARMWRDGVSYGCGTHDTIEAAVAARQAEIARVDQRVAGPEWEARGIPAGEALVDEDTVYHRAVAEYRATARLELRQRQQELIFTAPYVALVFMGDLHLGSPGTDIERVFAEAELVVSTPNAYVVTMGDLIDNFVLGKLRQARDNHRLAVTDEWVLVRRFMRKIAPRWPLAVGGNHDAWGELLLGVDVMRDQVATLAPKVLYQAHDAHVRLTVAGHDFPGRIRHRWRGYSIYNLTHGIERAAKWDQDFIWAAGAHTHASGVARGINIGGMSGIAVLCGSYKRIDPYSIAGGFPRPNESTAVGILFDAASHSMTGFESLDMLANVMRALAR